LLPASFRPNTRFRPGPNCKLRPRHRPTRSKSIRPIYIALPRSFSHSSVCFPASSESALRQPRLELLAPEVKGALDQLLGGPGAGPCIDLTKQLVRRHVTELRPEVGGRAGQRAVARRDEVVVGQTQLLEQHLRE